MSFPAQRNKVLTVKQQCSQSLVSNFRSLFHLSSDRQACLQIHCFLSLVSVRGLGQHVRQALLTSVLTNLGSRWPILFNTTGKSLHLMGFTGGICIFCTHHFDYQSVAWPFRVDNSMWRFSEGIMCPQGK